MGQLTEAEIKQVRDTLEKRGLTYMQLQTELLDHLVCDIENWMQQGMNFQQAKEKVFADIPENQLKTIQTETMEVVNKKNSALDIMTILSLLLLIGSSLFKILHWQGADILLLAGLSAIIITTVVGVYKGFYISPVKKGGFSALLLGLCFLIFIISFFFQILNWQGVVQLRLIAVIGLAFLVPALSFYFFKSKQSAQDHAVILLLEKNENKINRVLLSLVILGIAFKLPAIMEVYSYEFAPFLFPVLTIFLVGLYLVTLTWKAFITSNPEKNESAKGILLTVSVAGLLLFLLPTLDGIFPAKLRIGLTSSFYILVAITVMVYFWEYSQDQQRKILAFFSFILLCIPFLVLLFNLGLISGSGNELIFNSVYNLGTLSGLIILLIVFYRKRVFREFMMLMLAHYILNYPVLFH